MLIKRKTRDADRPRLGGLAAGLTSGVMDRRTFLARSGLTAAGAIATMLDAASKLPVVGGSPGKDIAPPAQKSPN